MVLSSKKNLYEILEISSNASESAIKSAYRKLARKYHPDLNSGDEICIKKFKEITEAYEILSDAGRKKNYDILRGFQSHPEAKFSETQKADTKKQEEKPKEDVFSHVFNDIFEGFKKTASSAKTQTPKPKQTQPVRGSDVYAVITITMAESIQGAARTVNILHTEACANCEGRIFLNGAKCPLCKGLGEQSIHKKLSVKIPANVKYGSKIRIANEGNKGYNGGKNGDLYLTIKIENDSRCKYEGLNVLCTIPITPFEAVLGVPIEVPTPNGKISMKVTPNTQSGQKFRIAGQGFKKGGKIGDMIVTVNIEVPKTPSEKELELYKELKNATKNDIRENK